MADEFDDGEVTLLPPWREALRRFVAAGFKPGDVIAHDWFYESFGLDRPHPTTPLGEAEPVRLEYLRQLSALRQALLSDHKTDLASKPGVGYEVVPPAEQSSRAWQEGKQEVYAALRRMRARMVNVDVARLTDEQRSAYADDLARSAAMRNAVRHGRRALPGGG